MDDLQYEDYLGRVRERWKEAFSQYDQLKVDAEQSVVRWEWADGQRHSLLPHYFKRYPGRGRRLKRPPASIGHYVCYGLDDQNRPRLRRTYMLADRYAVERIERRYSGGDQPEDAIFEAFYEYSHSLVEVIEFSRPTLIPLRVNLIFRENDRVVRQVSLDLNGYSPPDGSRVMDPDTLYKWLGTSGRFLSVERYKYEGKRLTRIDSYHEVPGLSPYFHEERFEYDDAGSLERIYSLRDDGTRRTVYQKRKKGETSQTIRESATQKMVQAIVDAIRAANLQERLYCIELSYQCVNRYFPPIIYPAPESYRQELLESDRPDAKFYIFTPLLGRRSRFLEITDPDALEACQLLEQEIWSDKKWDTGTRILRDVASALSRHDWTGILRVTPDFVVYAIDYEFEGHDIEGVLSASASQEQIQEWKEKGWLG